MRQVRKQARQFSRLKLSFNLILFGPASCGRNIKNLRLRLGYRYTDDGALRSMPYRKMNLDAAKALLRGSRSMDVMHLRMPSAKFQSYVEKGVFTMGQDGVSLPGQEDVF